MKITKRKPKMKITKRRKRKEPYSIQDAFMEVLMSLPDQKARHVALDAATGVGPGSVDLRKSAKIVLRAAKRIGWENWRARAKLEEVVA